MINYVLIQYQLMINLLFIFSNNWLGGDDTDHDTSSSSTIALFKYPVCATEVVGMTIDYDNSAASIIDDDSSISGLECINSNRLISSTCSISQSYELSSITSFSISNSDSSTNQYSWGSSSSLTLGTSSSSSVSTSNEFSFGFNEEVTVGTSVSAGFFGVEATVSTEVSVGSNQQWTESTENTRTSEQSQDITSETNEQNTESITTTNEFESQYDTITTTTVECNAEIDVPPSHSVQYSLIFSTVDTIINTYTDLKLTLCSAFLNPAAAANNDNFIFIDNIPGVIQHKKKRACTVQFEPAIYLKNDMNCDDEQQLAISIGSNYIPLCQSNNNTLYDGCQCDIGDSRTLGVCWCSDKFGNKLNSKTKQIEDGMSKEEVCIFELECDNTEIIINCAKAQKHAIEIESSYLPTCNDTNTEYYDGCQCIYDDMCWCVNIEDGTKIDGKAIKFSAFPDMSYQQICVSELQCENTKITLL